MRMFRLKFVDLITVRISSCGKVMFSQASVILSNGGGGNAWQEGVCGRGACVAGAVHGGGAHAWQGACVAGGHAW